MDILQFAHTAYVSILQKFGVPVVAQRMGRGIALLFHDRGTRRG